MDHLEEEDCWSGLVQIGRSGGGEEDPLGDFNLEMGGRVGGETWRKNSGGGSSRRKQVFIRKRELSGDEEEVDLKRNRVEPEPKEEEAPPQIRLLEHCVFCLRKTTTSEKSGNNPDQVSRAQIPFSNASNLLSTFNQIWPYLRHNKWHQSETLIGYFQRDCGISRKISELPTICSFCANTLKSVATLLTQLETQITKLGEIIQESNAGGEYSHRAENFQRAIRKSTLLPEEIEATLEFLRIESVKIKDLEEDLPLSPEGDEVEHFENEDESDSDYIKSEDDDSNSTSSSADQTDVEDEKPEVARSPDALQKRIQIVVTDDSVICDVCGQKFCNKYAVDGHKRRFHGINIVRKPPGELDDYILKTGFDSFTCTVEGCGEIFTQKCRVREHQRRVHINDPSLICDICSMRLSSRYALMNHKKGHEKNRRIPGQRCDLCKVSQRKDQLLEHVRNHVGDEYVIKCPNSRCPYAFAQPYSLRRHLSVWKNCKPSAPDGYKETDPKFACDTCDYTTKYGHALRTHINREHENSTKNYTCPISGCDQKFTQRQSVVIHLPQHEFCTGLTSQKCPLCPWSGQINLEKMEEHLKDKHQASEIITCKQCPFLFSSREHLIEHLFEHRFGGILCDICEDGVKYSRHANVLDHYFTVHKIGQKFSCGLCDSVFWKKGHFTDHMNEKHPKGEGATVPKKKFRCEECNVEYRMRISLKEHNIRCHGAEPFSCTFCTEKILTRMALNKHVRQHRGVVTPYTKGSFKCEVDGCGKIFNVKETLKRHHQVDHLGVRPVCDLCGKSFSHSTGLRTHKVTVHFGVRSFVCDVCGESFSNGTSLRRHKLIHTGERPFACEICGQRFRHKEVLKRHLVSHEKKGTDFKPSGPMKQVRKRVERKN